MPAPTIPTFVPLTSNQAYISTLTPDELFKAIAAALRPYQIEYSDLEDVHNILACAIVMPQLPSTGQFGSNSPKVKHKHKTRSTSLPQSASSTTRSTLGHPSSGFARYPKDGPPKNVNESFCFHHTDPLFKEAFPNIDLSAYTKPKPAKPVVKKDVKTPSPQPHIPSPSLPSSPPVLPTIAEVDEEDEPAQDAIKETPDKAKEEEKIAADGNTKYNGALSANTAAAPLESTANLDRIASIEDTTEDKIDVKLEDTTTNESEALADAQTYSIPLNSRNNSFKPRHAQDSPDSNDPDDTIFTQPDPATQGTELGYDTQPTQPEEQDNAEQLPTSQGSKDDSRDPRRSLRLSQLQSSPSPSPAPAPVPAPAPASSLGKRSRGSEDDEQDEPASKKSKGSISKI